MSCFIFYCRDLAACVAEKAYAPPVTLFLPVIACIAFSVASWDDMGKFQRGLNLFAKFDEHVFENFRIFC